MSDDTDDMFRHPTATHAATFVTMLGIFGAVQYGGLQGFYAIDKNMRQRMIDTNTGAPELRTLQGFPSTETTIAANIHVGVPTGLAFAIAYAFISDTKLLKPMDRLMDFIDNQATTVGNWGKRNLQRIITLGNKIMRL